ncbi:hypothetical protein [Rickettsia endosymbiont of Cardiosporidium cionae]|uniref:hypothetical protein n=1 Tax=Rickettsia endosymbiont of Cardiosporidium cionae TaxID=2777155 RepID=UPI001893F300|nr:hypothetical protein [Rickettsia endosymbiont of Cardiosporidium cionae]KAF8818711.1 hypothetical protein IHI24_000436 [Rickettsia endosymbiont of Cardiosporidium cionae]
MGNNRNTVNGQSSSSTTSSSRELVVRNTARAGLVLANTETNDRLAVLDRINVIDSTNSISFVASSNYSSIIHNLKNQAVSFLIDEVDRSIKVVSSNDNIENAYQRVIASLTEALKSSNVQYIVNLADLGNVMRCANHIRVFSDIPKSPQNAEVSEAQVDISFSTSNLQTLVSEIARCITQNANINQEAKNRFIEYEKIMEDMYLRLKYTADRYQDAMQENIFSFNSHVLRYGIISNIDYAKVLKNTNKSYSINSLSEELFPIGEVLARVVDYVKPFNVTFDMISTIKELFRNIENRAFNTSDVVALNSVESAIGDNRVASGFRLSSLLDFLFLHVLPLQDEEFLSTKFTMISEKSYFALYKEVYSYPLDILRQCFNKLTTVTPTQNLSKKGITEKKFVNQYKAMMMFILKQFYGDQMDIHNDCFVNDNQGGQCFNYDYINFENIKRMTNIKEKTLPDPSISPMKYYFDAQFHCYQAALRTVFFISSLSEFFKDFIYKPSDIINSQVTWNQSILEGMTEQLLHISSNENSKILQELYAAFIKDSQVSLDNIKEDLDDFRENVKRFCFKTLEILSGNSVQILTKMQFVEGDLTHGYHIVSDLLKLFILSKSLKNILAEDFTKFSTLYHFVNESKSLINDSELGKSVLYNNTDEWLKILCAGFNTDSKSILKSITNNLIENTDTQYFRMKLLFAKVSNSLFGINVRDEYIEQFNNMSVNAEQVEEVNGDAIVTAYCSNPGIASEITKEHGNRNNKQLNDIVSILFNIVHLMVSDLMPAVSESFDRYFPNQELVTNQEFDNSYSQNVEYTTVQDCLTQVAVTGQDDSACLNLNTTTLTDL